MQTPYRKATAVRIDSLLWGDENWATMFPIIMIFLYSYYEPVLLLPKFLDICHYEELKEQKYYYYYYH